MLLLCGCTPTNPDKPTTQPVQHPISNTDPCAMQMHDLCGAFLLFYLQYQRLPANLQELVTYPPNAEITSLNCPASGQPYVYNPDGILFTEKNSLVILHDASGIHAGHRWVIAIDQPQPYQPLVAKVIALPERFFLLRK